MLFSRGVLRRFGFSGVYRVWSFNLSDFELKVLQGFRTDDKVGLASG